MPLAESVDDRSVRLEGGPVKVLRFASLVIVKGRGELYAVFFATWWVCEAPVTRWWFEPIVCTGSTHAGGVAATAHTGM